jgi:hypothetical protein
MNIKKLFRITLGFIFCFAMILFLLSIIDHGSRNEDGWQKSMQSITQDISSVKVADQK